MDRSGVGGSAVAPGRSRRARALQHRALDRPPARGLSGHCQPSGHGIAMLEVTSLSKEYPTARGPLRVLRDVSLQMKPGDAAAIMGPSGTGKSSLLYIVGGLEPPSAGTVTLDGTNP